LRPVLTCSWTYWPGGGERLPTKRKLKGRSFGSHATLTPMTRKRGKQSKKRSVGGVADPHRRLLLQLTVTGVVLTGGSFGLDVVRFVREETRRQPEGPRSIVKRPGRPPSPPSLRMISAEFREAPHLGESLTVQKIPAAQHASTTLAPAHSAASSTRIN
jgi:hypothetical protein